MQKYLDLVEVEKTAAQTEGMELEAGVVVGPSAWWGAYLWSCRVARDGVGGSSQARRSLVPRGRARTREPRRG